MEFFGLLLNELLQVGSALFHLIAPFGELALIGFEHPFFLDLGLVLLINKVLTLFDAAFMIPQFVAGLFHFAVEFLPPGKQVVFRLQLGGLQDVIGFALGLGDNLGGSGLLA